MKILIVCSKRFYGTVTDTKAKLEELGHEVFIPDCMKDMESENKAKALGKQAHIDFKQTMYRQSEYVIKNMDAILVLNFDRDDQAGYIGGATLIEMYDAFRMGKKLFMQNPATKKPDSLGVWRCAKA